MYKAPTASFYLWLTQFEFLCAFGINSLSLDVDECKKKTHGCDANAKCHNIEGLFICKCKAGYVGNGQNCVGKELICFMIPHHKLYS